MADPGAASQGLVTLLGELAAFGLAIGLSPLHIGLLLLLLLGPRPLQRGGWFVAGWLITAALAVLLLLTGILCGFKQNGGFIPGKEISFWHISSFFFTSSSSSSPTVPSSMRQYLP
jgi:hypothetical protein